MHVTIAKNRQEFSFAQNMSRAVYTAKMNIQTAPEIQFHKSDVHGANEKRIACVGLLALEGLLWTHAVKGRKTYHFYPLSRDTKNRLMLCSPQTTNVVIISDAVQITGTVISLPT